MWSRRHVSSLPRSTSYLVSLIDSFERGSKQPRSIASSFPSNWPQFVKITRYVVTSWWNNDSRNFTYSSAMQLEIRLSDSLVQTLLLRFFQFSSFLAIRFRWIVRRRSFSVFYSCLFHLWSQSTNIAVYRRVVNDIVKRIIIWFILSVFYALFLISKLKFLTFSWIYFSFIFVTRLSYNITYSTIVMSSDNFILIVCNVCSNYQFLFLCDFIDVAMLCKIICWI